MLISSSTSKKRKIPKTGQQGEQLALSLKFSDSMSLAQDSRFLILNILSQRLDEED